MAKSIDVFAATNPAFLSLVLLGYIEGYVEEAGSGLPFSLAIFPIPIVLSGDLDSTFDGTNIKTGFYSWVKQNPQISLNLNARINDSIDYIKPAISYGVARKIIVFDGSGKLLGLPKSIGNFYGSAFPEQMRSPEYYKIMVWGILGFVFLIMVYLLLNKIIK